MKSNFFRIKLISIIIAILCIFNVNASQISSSDISTLKNNAKNLVPTSSFSEISSTCYNGAKAYSSSFRSVFSKYECRQRLTSNSLYFKQEKLGIFNIVLSTIEIPYVYLYNYGSSDCLNILSLRLCNNYLTFSQQGSYQTFMNYNYSSDSKAIVTKVAEIGNKYKNNFKILRSNIQSLVSDYNTLKDYLDRNNDKNDNTEKEIIAVNTQISSIKSQITALTNKSSNLSTSNVTLNDQIKLLKENITFINNSYSLCLNNSSQISEKLKTYKKYSEETAEEGYQYTFLTTALNKVCSLKTNIQDLVSMEPSLNIKMNEALAAFYLKQDSTLLDSIYGGNDLYVFRE